jgi:hypothetical protein
MWDNYKKCNVFIMGISEGEDKGTKDIYFTY